MASIQIDGINSGLPTGDLIDAEIGVLEIPLNKTRAKLKDIETFNSSLRSLSGSLSTYGDTLKTLTAADFNQYSGTSSNPGVTITATTAKNPVSLSLSVQNVATRHSMVTSSATALNSTAISITIGGTAHSLTADSTSYADTAKAINGAGIGVNATVVAAGKDGVTGENLYRLQLTSEKTGTGSQFTASIGGADVLASPGASSLSTGTDATVLLYAGTAAEQLVTSESNTFTGVVAGVDFTVSAPAVGAGNINIDVLADVKAQEGKASMLVSDLNKILSYIDSSTKVTTTGSGTTTSAKAGIFTGDLLIRDLRESLIGSVTTPSFGSTTYATIGIDIDKYGAVTFDAEKYNTAMAANPAQTTAFMEELAGRLNKVADTASNKYGGSISEKLQGGESEVRTLADQIDRHQSRLDMRRSTLQARFTTMETLLGTMKTTQSYLEAMYSTMFKSDKD